MEKANRTLIFYGRYLHLRVRMSIGDLPVKKIALLCHLFLFTVTSGYASEPEHFLDYVDGVSGSDTLELARMAAQKRKWTIAEKTEDSITITLDHRKYRAKLVILNRSNALVYTDHSLVQKKTKDLIGDIDNSWSESRAPAGWIANLQKDTQKMLFNVNLASISRSTTSSDCPARLSIEEAESKLVSLKSFFERELINEQDYEAKRQEILSSF